MSEDVEYYGPQSAVDSSLLFLEKLGVAERKDLRARYLEAAKYDWPPAKHNWTVFKQYVPWLIAEITRWKRHEVHHDSLTALAWHVASEVYKKDGFQLLDFNERKQRVYLQNGLMTLCKLLCEDYERRHPTVLRVA